MRTRFTAQNPVHSAKILIERCRRKSARRAAWESQKCRWRWPGRRWIATRAAIGQTQAAADGISPACDLHPPRPRSGRRHGSRSGQGSLPGMRIGRLRVGDRPMLAHPGVAFLLDDPAAGADDCARDPTAVRQVRIGRVDNRIHTFLGQVTLDNFNAGPGTRGDRLRVCVLINLFYPESSNKGGRMRDSSSPTKTRGPVNTGPLVEDSLPERNRSGCFGDCETSRVCVIRQLLRGSDDRGKACGSRTARSARTLRFRVIPAVFMPYTRRL